MSTDTNYSFLSFNDVENWREERGDDFNRAKSLLFKCKQNPGLVKEISQKVNCSEDKINELLKHPQELLIEPYIIVHNMAVMADEKYYSKVFNEVDIITYRDQVESVFNNAISSLDEEAHSDDLKESLTAVISSDILDIAKDIITTDPETIAAICVELKAAYKEGF